MRAGATLQGRSFDEFDKLSVSGKWLFYPRLIGVGSYDPGQQPFQGFQVLIGRRNALVHYKVRTNRLRYGFAVPDFVEQMGLRTREMEESLKTVSSMVASLATMERRELPGWIANDEWWDIFEFWRKHELMEFTIRVRDGFKSPALAC
jgi:hypothetical protein